MYRVYSNHKIGSHKYDVQCSCTECVSWEFKLQDSIRAEKGLSTAELTRPITEKTFKV